MCNKGTKFKLADPYAKKLFENLMAMFEYFESLEN